MPEQSARGIEPVIAEFNWAFRFLAPVEVLFGRGRAGDIPRTLGERGWSRALVLTDENVAAHGGGWVRDRLAEAGVACELHALPASEPTDATLAPAVAAAVAWRPDVVIAVGGGSVLDSAKVVSVAVHHDTPDFLPFLKPGTRGAEGIPWIAVPTTAGTGAEITRGTVVVNGETGVKRGFARGGNYARMAVLDSALTDSLPPGATAQSGLDAFAQAAESYLAPRPFPVGDMLAVMALTLVGAHLEGAIATGAPEHRDGMMLAAWASAQAFSTGAGLTISHVFSDLIGPRKGLAHGAAGSLLLPGVVALAEESRPGRAAVLARALGGEEGPGGAVAAVSRILALAGAPRLHEFVGREEGAAMVAEALEMSDPGGVYDRDESRRAFEISYDVGLRAPGR
jgi:alcohol dehydrogenase class IV